ncbi:MAG: VOC family protein [Paracoccus sp. (in: a-proteobacteria)]|uniref:VOC family protein n=1 Tax=Paracoccus sp. TaxID=267 RepID=UPI0026E0CBC3|nr:VOC family protein [Paracoccus sp. (in: a-proteobacteria)]MDO5632178.1 VOC family protein [Paracoccus sp. (in: a-proteobacteria)]
MSDQGNPCWYELNTSNPPEAGRFYATVLGWQTADAGMPGFDYTLAGMGDAMVAGLTATAGDQPPHWLICFAVDDCAASCAAMHQDGAKILSGPTEVPGTGLYALIADPQGARFGILQADMSQMTAAEIAQAQANAPFDQSKPGHGNWNELMTSDPEAGLAFYARHFGWTKGDAMDMGEMGTYQLIRRNGADIGAIMGLGDAPVSHWLPYFGVDSTESAIERIKSAGGSIHHGPTEVPGGAWIAITQDPQGAWFAVVGPR